VGECNEDSKYVVAANALSPEDLNKLLKDVNDLFLSSPLKYSFDIQDAPESIKALSPVSLSSHGGKELWVYLHTCGLDSKVILFIDAGKNEVSLQWGDPMSPNSGSKVLWPKT
jgi:hypothetical protein